MTVIEAERPTIAPLYSSPVQTRDGRLLPSHGAKVCRWIENNFRLGRGDYLGEPIRLTSYHRRWIWRLNEYYPETGQRRYKRALLGTAKGNAKTPFEAMLGAAELAGPMAPNDPLVLVAASTLDQADLVFGDLKIGLSHDDAPLKDLFLPYDVSLQMVDRPGEAKRVAAVAGSNDGPRASVLLADELHEWTGRLREVFMVLDGAIGKRRDTFTVGISTAGSDKSSLLGEQYDRGRALASGELVDDGTLFEWYEIPETVEVPEKIESDEDLARWTEAIRWANPALSEPGFDFLSPDYPRDRFDGPQTIPRFQWFRYHGNRWTRSEKLWLPPGSWEARRDARGAPPFGSEVVLGFSGTYNGDSAGLVGVTIDRHIFTIDAWEPPDGPAGLTYQVPRAAVDAVVSDAMRSYKVRRLVVNPAGWHGEAQTWSDRWGPVDNDGRGVVLEFDWQYQTKRKGAACSVFYTAVTTGTLSHDGDPRLARHLDSAQTVEQKDIAYIARGGRDGSCIELAAAAVMALDQVMATPPPRKGGRFIGGMTS